MATMPEQLPPHNIEAEQSVLGAMMVDRQAVLTAIEKVNVDHFYRNNHRVIFQAMLELEDNNQPIDLVTVIDRLRKTDQLANAGDIGYVTTLSGVTPIITNVEQYCKIVREKAILRNLIRVSNEIMVNSYQDNEVDEILDQAEKKFFELSQNRDTKSFASIKEVAAETFAMIEEAYRKKGSFTGLRTGFTQLDRMTAGLQKSDLIILAARPSMGKTAFSLSIAQNVALREGKGVAYFNLEMDRHQLVHRMICAESQIDSQRIRTGYIEEGDWEPIGKAVAALGNAPIYIDDTPGISILELRSKARRLKAEKSIDLLIVDYLQLITSRNRNENRQQEIAYITRQLKELARELEVPIIALAQLSRQVEQRQDKKPNLSDLRESGEIEQTADIVGFLYREDYYNPETENKNIMDIIIGKHRNGPTGVVKLLFLKNIGRFANVELKYEEE